MKQYCERCIYEALPHTVINVPQLKHIFTEGTRLSHVYRIKEGLVKMNRVHPSGDEKIFDVLGPNDYLALIAVLQGKEDYVASAIALTDVTLIKMDTHVVLNAYHSNKIFQSTCLQCAVTRSTMFQDKLFQTSNVDTEEKILNILHILAKKFGSTHKGVVTLNLPFSKTVLASIVGIRRETLSRKLSKMQQHNIIRINKNTYYFNRL
jgi:CRP/FNR family transcriptional regulator